MAQHNEGHPTTRAASSALVLRQARDLNSQLDELLESRQGRKREKSTSAPPGDLDVGAHSVSISPSSV